MATTMALGALLLVGACTTPPDQGVPSLVGCHQNDFQTDSVYYSGNAAPLNSTWYTGAGSFCDVEPSFQFHIVGATNAVEATAECLAAGQPGAWEEDTFGLYWPGMKGLWGCNTW